MKKVIIVALTVLVVIFAAGIIKDQILKSTITVVATNILGAPVHIDGFSLGILTQSVKISGFRIYNPAGFSKSILVDLPKIKVKYNLFALLRKKIHIVNAEIELKEMGLEKNAEGKLNVDSLKVVQEQDK
ncbi:MAG: AsmA family protein, partial [Candidatus Omnitrophica bacterium]|nr:AsmA family protein [Candidatus Omnitrophota bacterium]